MPPGLRFVVVVVFVVSDVFCIWLKSSKGKHISLATFDTMFSQQTPEQQPRKRDTPWKMIEDGASQTS